MSIKHLFLIAVAAILGCAPASGTPPAAPRSTNVITGEEMSGAHADVGTVYDAVARLRPNWLAPHGAQTYAVVFVDGQRYGELSSLRNIPAYHAADIRYYDITQAGAIFGIRGDGGGVIEVRMKVRE